MKLADLARRLTARAPPEALSPPSSQEDPGALPARQGLFVIGAARSGTTVMQNALNHSPEIFLLGEPQLHLDPDQPGFAARYNAMHRAWSNQETKSTFLPPLLDQDGPSGDYLRRLAQLYRWVGAKVVINARRDPAWTELLFAYHARHFYQARYVFTFRDPLAVVSSTRDLQILTGSEREGLRALMANYAEVVGFYVRMQRNLPHVRAVCHDDVGPAVFEDLGAWLGVALDGAAGYYDGARVRRYAPEGFDAAELEILHVLTELYADLRRSATEGFALPQLEQNDTNLAPNHYTALGSIARRAAVIGEACRR